MKVSKLASMTSNELEIYYFLLNNGFEYTEASLHVDDIIYIKNDLTLTFYRKNRIFIVKDNDSIIFEINNCNDTLLGNSWSISNLGTEITLNDIIPFFRENKIKDLLNDV